MATLKNTTISDTGYLGLPSGSGGSGVVILRYPTSFTISQDGGLTIETSVVNNKNVTQIKAGTGTISFS